ncbi:ATP synthase subunit B family protein [Campylobacter canadensis]|uniref:F0F1 ATP synthase subunit B n=1 Tax=Campylobacter canadensis TaxID=449520 RepID=A0ABS7WTY3_9BACT|nr:hypothetical protein [Campylobacter canadensis]MBZ7987369.1 hypothetical protein [Campylobacter canadensis]MBZ7998460.1 hypothetical protein [Campylobacter canadensis]
MFDDFSLEMMAISIGIFLIMIIVLQYILYKPLTDFMEKRDELIQSNEDKIKQVSNDAQNNEILINKIYTDAKNTMQSIRQEQITKSNEEAKELILNATKQLDDEINLFKKNLEEQKVEFKKQLLANSNSYAAILQSFVKSI